MTGSDASRPAWMERVADQLAQDTPEYFRTFAPPVGWHRRSAVLMLFAPGAPGAPGVPGARGEQVLLTERAPHLRSHPGQVSFPGGRMDPEDETIVRTALREAQEEVGVAPGYVDVVLTMPELFLTPSQNSVAPVLAWCPAPSPARVIDPNEVARAAWVPVADLVDPARRFTVTHPLGYRGPGFEAEGLFVWGFTAMLLSSLLDIAGLALPWDEGREVPLPDRLASPGLRS
jgi:8-oxo-dGTP pyrophosphatase MutT (NUDIX family)